MSDKENQQGKSVGAIIRDGNGRFLCQYRLKKPTGLAMVAGHIDPGEIPEGALNRELHEETGLLVKTARLVFREYISCDDSPCGHGHTGHEWWVYEIKAEGEPKRIEEAKHRFVKFMSVEEMRPYIVRKEYDPNWFEHILPALGII